tara:strand:- start:227 stop:421 length:195 start_codon:yes stop_codon:yes gene_type:complete
MKPKTTEDAVADAREWSLNRLDSDDISVDDAKALMEEFYEWIDPEEHVEIMSLEPLEEFFDDRS